MALTRVRFSESSTSVIEGDIVDADGEAVAASELTAATLTLWDMDTYVTTVSPTEGVINDRDSQTILNANDVTIDEDGHFVWQVQPEDNIIVTPRRQIERHRALMTFVWADGRFQLECEIEVLNLRGAN